MIKGGTGEKAITVEDWALVSKAPGGKLTITNDKTKDPGGARGALFGGGAGLVLAALSGPIGLGAVAGGAAIGAVTAAVRDSGFKNDDIEAVSRFMADGRTGIMVATPLAEADAFDAFVAEHDEFEASDRKHHVDIVPGRDFEQALEEYRRAEAGVGRHSSAPQARDKRRRHARRGWPASPRRPPSAIGRRGGALVAAGSRPPAGRSSPGTCAWAVTSSTSSRSTRARRRRSSWWRCAAGAGATSASPRRPWTTASGPRCGAPSGRCWSGASCPTAGRSRTSRCAWTSSRWTATADGGTAVRHHRGDPAVGEGHEGPCYTPGRRGASAVATLPEPAHAGAEPTRGSPARRDGADRPMRRRPPPMDPRRITTQEDPRAHRLDAPAA